MTATPQHLVEVTEVELYDEARAWIADCTDQLPADCTDLTAPEVRALVAAADVVLVGAATVRDEDYGTPERPALAIVTRGTIARTDRLYPPSGAEPIVYSGHGESVDLRAVLGDLYARGHRRVLAEGGPGVLGALLILT